MPQPTYTPLATVTLGTAVGSLSFQNIPATFRDLILTYSGTVSVAQGLNVYHNNDTTSGNYSRVLMLGDGSSALSFLGTDARALEIGTVQTTAIGQIMDYSATDKHKTSLWRGGPANSFTIANAMRWANTAAVNRLDLVVSSGGSTMSVGSTISLYGIAS